MLYRSKPLDSEDIGAFQVEVQDSPLVEIMNSTSNANSQCLMDTQDSSAAYHPSMYITLYYNQQIDASVVLLF